MATASPPRPAPATTTRGEPSGARRDALLAAATVVGVAVAMFLIYRPSYVNYDAQYALLWARDAWQGFTPEYTAEFAPTPHPLATAVSSLALPFGHQADLAILWLILLLFGALVWITYRLGAELFSAPVGIVAALVVATRPAMQRDALLAYQDIPFAVLVVAAVLLESRRPRRGVPVLVLLGVAGLLRPEAWALAGLYWLYLWPASTPRRRIATALLVAAAPLIWALTDWIVTGDALHSLHGTADLAEANDRRRSPEQVPYWTAQYFGFALREPLVLGVPIGLAFAWLYARRRSALPVATVIAMTLVFAIGPFFGLPLIRRYVETPAVILSVFYGLAVCGWLLLPPGRARRRWQAAGLLAAALSIAYLPWHARELRSIGQRVDRNGATYADLQRAAEAPPVRQAFEACAPLHAGDHRPVPFVRYWLDGEPGSVRAGGPPGRLLLLPRRGSTIYNAETFPDVTPPPSHELIYRNRSWRLYAEPGCVTRPPS
jgi:4-amino-4-deoxy-L-arabinose transferase-like glycosyltransferase